MTEGSSLKDTAADAQEVHIRLLSRRSPSERARRVRDLTVAASAFAIAGLRRRHPEADEQELLLRLAVLRLGSKLVEQAYGWRAPHDGA